jgi:PIN domain nuclease of toxin-antitoxin system
LKLLLDTHIWLWLIGDSERLGRQVFRELRSDANELWLSPMSTWEALTLHHKGRIKLDADLSLWRSPAYAGIREAPPTHEIAFVARHLDLHQGPADRIPAATAQVMDMTLVTADQRLLGLGNIRTLANR